MLEFKIRNRSVSGFGCRTGLCRISIYCMVSRIVPDQNQVLGRRNIRLPENLINRYFWTFVIINYNMNYYKPCGLHNKTVFTRVVHNFEI